MAFDEMLEFVTARLGERKEAALAWLNNAEHTAPSPDPEKVLAQIEATRKIIANSRTALDQGWQLGDEAREATAHIAVRTLQHLAKIDADHPDYEPKWEL